MLYVSTKELKPVSSRPEFSHVRFAETSENLSSHTARAWRTHTHMNTSIHAKLNTNTELYCCLWRALVCMVQCTLHMICNMTSLLPLTCLCAVCMCSAWIILLTTIKQCYICGNHDPPTCISSVHMRCDMYIYTYMIFPSLIYFERISSLFLCLYTSLIIVVLSRSTASLLCCLPRPCSHANLIHTASQQPLPSSYLVSPQFSFNLKWIDFAYNHHH